MKFACVILEAGCVLDWNASAAWAQAILSAVAIYAAVKISKSQAKQIANDAQSMADKQQRLRDSAKLEAIKVRIEQIRKIIIFINNEIPNAQAIRKYSANKKASVLTEIREAYRDINELSIYELPSPKCVEITVHFRAAISEFLAKVQMTFNYNYLLTPPEYEDFAQSILGMDDGLQEILRDIEFEIHNLNV